MKRSETISIHQAVSALWDEDPDLYEQRLIYQLQQYLPTALGRMAPWLVGSSCEEGVLRLWVSSPAVRQALHLGLRQLQQHLNSHLGVELIRSIEVYS